MNLYLLTQQTNTGYDTFSSCVVVAENEEAAKKLRPDGIDWDDDHYGMWANDHSEVHAKYIGSTEVEFLTPIICASFHAG